MKKAQAGVLVGLLVMVIITVTVLSVIYTQLNQQSATTLVTDDQFTLAAGCNRVTEFCFQKGSSSAENMSSHPFTLDVEYLECGEGSLYYGINVINTSYGAGSLVNTSYTEIQCNYIAGGLTRNLINYLPILLAISIFVGVAVFVK